MADTVNEAIQYSFLQYRITFSHTSISTAQHQHCSQTQSTVSTAQHQHCSQTQSTVSPQCLTPSVTPTSITTLHKHTHSLYFNSYIFRKQEGQQNILKLQSALLQINFLSFTWFWYLYSFMPLQNTSCSPIFQNFKQCISWVIILYFKVISLLCLYNT